jgi:hypothetical protein
LGRRFADVQAERYSAGLTVATNYEGDLPGGRFTWCWATSRVMQTIAFLFWQLASYGIFAWITFIAIAFLVARYLPWCIPIGHLVVVGIVYFLDVRWIQSEMSKPGWDGTPDMDIVFAIGMFIRVFLVNTALLPLSYVGVWVRRRQRSLSYERPVA